MKFYIPKDEYLDYLREFEPRIMQSKNSNYSNKKMVFGTVFEIDGFNYYVPLSSKKAHQTTQCLTKLTGIFKK
ncbi:MAG: type III toxin-antitoxin system ToxN/AbiQ family toxin, partial [Cetobacterium sp.]